LVKIKSLAMKKVILFLFISLGLLINSQAQCTPDTSCYPAGNNWDMKMCPDTIDNLPRAAYEMPYNASISFGLSGPATNNYNRMLHISYVTGLPDGIYASADDAILSGSFRYNGCISFWGTPLPDQIGTFPLGIVTWDQILTSPLGDTLIIDTLYGYSIKIDSSVWQTDHICLVTVDTATDKNKIVWNKTLSVGTDSFNIYKETSLNVYTKIGSTAFTDPNYFIDAGSNPLSHADKYKVTAVDNAGAESFLSPFHKTMNLVISTFGTTMGLSWTPYEDGEGIFVPNKYYIFRGTQAGNMQILDSISSSFTSYNDLNVTNNYFYMVGVKKDIPCTISKTNNAWSVSNKTKNFGIGITENLKDQIQIFPNPAKENLTIVCPVEAKIYIFNIEGQILKTTKTESKVTAINITTFSKGMYFIKVQNGNGVAVRKVIIE
jgi:hypothetical protein